MVLKINLIMFFRKKEKEEKTVRTNGGTKTC